MGRWNSWQLFTKEYSTLSLITELEIGQSEGIDKLILRLISCLNSAKLTNSGDARKFKIKDEYWEGKW